MAVAQITIIPVRILIEACVKCRLQPIFEFLGVAGKQHCPIFTYGVTVHDMNVVATGSSKQKAKNAAAAAMIQKMMENPEMKCYIEAALVNNQIVNYKELAFHKEEDNSTNPVGKLQELCVSQRWTHPHYTLVGENPSKNRMFTISCHVQGQTETGTESSKKKAKRIAAKNMYDKLNRMLSEDSEMHSSPGPDECGRRLKYLYDSSLKGSKVPTLTAPVKDAICHYFHEMVSNKREKLTQLQRMPSNSPNFDSVQYLQEIAAEQNFHVTYTDIDKKSFRRDFQCFAQISTVALVFYGHGATTKEAQFSAAQCALEYLKEITKSCGCHDSDNHDHVSQLLMDY